MRKGHGGQLPPGAVGSKQVAAAAYGFLAAASGDRDRRDLGGGARTWK
jgi:hypothetical protein